MRPEYSPKKFCHRTSDPGVVDNKYGQGAEFVTVVSELLGCKIESVIPCDSFPPLFRAPLGVKYPVLAVETLEVMIPPVTEETSCDLMLGIAAMLDYSAVPYSCNYAAGSGGLTRTNLLLHFCS